MGVYEIQHAIKSHIFKIDTEAKIILFGSRARKDSNSESDWDILILTPKETSVYYKNQIRDELFFAEMETNQVISSIIQNENVWNNYKSASIYLTIQKEGIQL